MKCIRCGDEHDILYRDMCHYCNRTARTLTSTDTKEMFITFFKAELHKLGHDVSSETLDMFYNYVVSTFKEVPK